MSVLEDALLGFVQTFGWHMTVNGARRVGKRRVTRVLRGES
jgi:hypothetical protein